MLSHIGPLAHAKMRLSGGLSPVSWLLSLGVGIGAVLVVLVPAVARVLGGAVFQRRAGRRQALASALGRSGSDLALFALAALAYFQLAHYGSGPSSSVSATAAGSAAAGGGALSADASGRLGLDPVLVTAPTLALCAGTVLALRLLPLAARLGERWAGRRRGLPGALAGWQFARRPRRNAGPVLLMVFAVSMGMLALGQGASLSASQRDQSAFASLGGLRVANLAVPALGQGGVLDQLPGGSRFLPVSRQDLPLQAGRIGQLLAIDTKAAATSVRMRPDLTGGRTPAQFFAPLTGTGADSSSGSGSGGTDGGGLVLPGKPIRLNLDLSVRTSTSAGPPSADGEFYVDPSIHAPSVKLELRDRHGLPFEAVLPGVPADGDVAVSADLAPLIGSPAGRAAYPLTLAGVKLTYDGPAFAAMQQQLTVHRMTGTDVDSGATTAIGTAGQGWSVLDGSTLAPANGQDLFGVTYKAGKGQLDNTTQLTVGAPGSAPPTVLDALATKDYLTATGAAVGQEVPLSLGTASLKVRIAAVVPTLPGVGGGTGGPTTALMVDLTTVNRMLGAAQNPRCPHRVVAARHRTGRPRAGPGRHRAAGGHRPRAVAGVPGARDRPAGRSAGRRPAERAAGPDRRGRGAGGDRLRRRRGGRRRRTGRRVRRAARARHPAPAAGQDRRRRAGHPDRPRPWRRPRARNGAGPPGGTADRPHHGRPPADALGAGGAAHGAGPGAARSGGRTARPAHRPPGAAPCPARRDHRPSALLGGDVSPDREPLDREPAAERTARGATAGRTPRPGSGPGCTPAGPPPCCWPCWYSAPPSWPPRSRGPWTGTATGR